MFVPHFMLLSVLFALLYCGGVCMQYVGMLHKARNTEEVISTWSVSTASFSDDSPFDHVQLPVDTCFFCNE